MKKRCGLKMKTGRCHVFFDMDGTLTEWREVSSGEELYRKGYFLSLNPNKNVVRAVKEIAQSSADVYILSCILPDSPYAQKEKEAWLRKYIPFLPEENWIFLPCGQNKAETAKRRLDLEHLGEEDILVDDYSANLRDWKAAGGQGIKLMNGSNGTKGTWQGLKVWHWNALQQLPVLLRVKKMRHRRQPDQLSGTKMSVQAGQSVGWT